MKFSLSVLALSAVAEAHYTIPRISANGVSGADWQYTRYTENWQNNGPVEDVSSSKMTCYERTPGTPASATLAVTAGGSVTFGINPNLYHPGPYNVYMAKAPSTAAAFDGKGQVWFKIANDEARITASDISWPNYNQATITVKIPQCIANGEYLIRFEHIGLHSASATNGAQLYISCSQLSVTGGSGSARPSLMSFPGAYNSEDPGLNYLSTGRYLRAIVLRAVLLLFAKRRPEYVAGSRAYRREMLLKYIESGESTITIYSQKTTRNMFTVQLGRILSVP